MIGMKGCGLIISYDLLGATTAVYALKRDMQFLFFSTAADQWQLQRQKSALWKLKVPLEGHRLRRLVGALPSSSSTLAAAAGPAVTVTDRTVALPIDFYEVLGADTQDPTYAILKAYESRLDSSPADGFSQNALLVRQEILKGAYQTLAHPESRKDYNTSLVEDEARTIMVDVPFNKVPGVLCLLQEVGEMEIVLQVGRKLLQDRLTRTNHIDVVLAMALAYVEFSREAMARTPPAVIQSCEFLECSLKLLQEGGGINFCAPLQQQIKEALLQMKPQFVLELLALPLDRDYESKRQIGLQGIKKILWTTGDGGSFKTISVFSREEYKKIAFSHLTAAELVALFTTTPSNIPAESWEVYAVSLAHVAEGFVRKKPHLIQEADSLFSELQQANALLGLPDDVFSIDHKLAYALERGMCALLLGDIETCRGWLGLHDPNSLCRDQFILKFIESSSTGEGGDYLPGICKVLECWLGEVSLRGFRDMNGLQVSLKEYFDDPVVFKYLENLDRGKSPLVAGSAILELRTSVGAALNTVKSSAFETLQKLLSLRQPMGNCDYMSGTTNAIPEQKAVLNGTPQLDSIRATDAPGHSDILEGAKETYESQVSLALQIGYICVFTGVLAAYGWNIYAPKMISTGNFRLLKVPNSGTVNNFPGSEKSRRHMVLLPLDGHIAEKLIRKWQVLKSKALGRQHEVDKLSEVLDGKMLHSWSQRGREVQKSGWYWEYKLTNLNIDSVNMSEDGTRAVVEATLWEDANLHNERTQIVTDSYHSSYSTRYDLAVLENQWKIIAGVVLRS